MPSVSTSPVGSPTSAPKAGALDEKKWQMLLDRIRDKNCTPFLGPETCFGSVPAASQIAKLWAVEYGFPLEDSDDLPRVAQFVVHHVFDGDSDYVKGLFAKQLCRELKAPDLSDPDEPHRILASLDLPIYVCTCCSNFMFQALKATRRKDPRRDWCRWNRDDTGEPSVLDSNYLPDPANPLVYHLYGHIDAPSSIVLTEDDYLDFLVQTSTDQNLIPHRIQATFVGQMLFLGYQFSDLGFRVLLRKLVSIQREKQRGKSRKRHLSVQMVTAGEVPTPSQIESIKTFFIQYYSHIDICIYWGTSRQFLAELSRRWEAYNGTATTTP